MAAGIVVVKNIAIGSSHEMFLQPLAAVPTLPTYTEYIYSVQEVILNFSPETPSSWILISYMPVMQRPA